MHVSLLNDIRTSTFPVIPPPQCEWRWLAGNMIDGSSFVGLAEPRPFSGRWEGAWRGYTRKSQKKACWFCVPKDLICINCICMYGWTKTVAETIHRLKSVVCFLFGAVRSSQKMGSRLAFSFCAKRCTNWHSKISQCRCSLFHSARLHRRGQPKAKKDAMTLLSSCLEHLEHSIHPWVYKIITPKFNHSIHFTVFVSRPCSPWTPMECIAR